MNKKYFITEVFSEAAYQGNQLATFPDAAELDSAEMQKIARAFNFAETTFIVGGSLETGFDVRIFTPDRELPFAGHPTLGTSHLIRTEILGIDLPELTLNLGVGPIVVQFSDDGVIWMNQNEPTFGDVYDAQEVADELGLSLEDIDSRFPCQKVSTGLEFLMVPVCSYESLKSAYVGRGRFAQGCFVFCQGGYTLDQQIQARMFAGALGVSEDPATGSANGCLAAYMVEHRYLGGSEVDVCVGQGYEIGRPSQLYLRSQKLESDFVVRVGGKVRLVAAGEWLL